jgi:ligand-binding sensor domain-containing protein
LLAYLLPSLLCAQSEEYHEIKGIPTKQIYDLMVDSRGFLWIGHELGITRYDGSSFTNFSNPHQVSLALGDICEDQQGKIWCRNFCGQIFYVKDEKMTFLSSYDYTKEPRFQRMVILGDNLVASSSRGLFLCNTSTLKSSYLKCGDGTSIISIALSNNKIIANGQGKWYCYDPRENAAIKQMTISPEQRVPDSVSLQPYGMKDTIYSFSTVTGVITKLLVKADNLTIVGKVKTGGFLNTINPSGSNTWIHTKNESFKMDGSEKITGYNLTDLVLDKDGNSWMSSFKYGLLLKYKYDWEKINRIKLDDDEVITAMEDQKGINVFGTNKGKVILEDSASWKIIRKFNLPFSAGPVEYMKVIDNSRVIISTSFSVFMLKDAFKNLENIANGFTLKCALLVDTAIYLAASNGLHELINSQPLITYQA